MWSLHKELFVTSQTVPGKCHYVTSHRHQFLEIELTQQRIRIATLPRKVFHSIKKSNQRNVFVRFWLRNLIREDS